MWQIIGRLVELMRGFCVTGCAQQGKIPPINSPKELSRFENIRGQVIDMVMEAFGAVKSGQPVCQELASHQDGQQCGTMYPAEGRVLIECHKAIISQFSERLLANWQINGSTPEIIFLFYKTYIKYG